MTKAARPTYATEKCTICGCPVKIVCSGEGMMHVYPLYVTDQDRSRLADELVAERAEVVRLRGRIDALVIERKELAIVAQKAITDIRQIAQQNQVLTGEIELLRDERDERERNLTRLATENGEMRKRLEEEKTSE